MSLPALPTEEQAIQFATMLETGLPASRAVLYFLEETPSPGMVAETADRWMRCRAVRAAKRALLDAKGIKPFHEMSLDERMRYALDLHYSQLATLLHLKNYIEADASEKTKMDTARTSLEAKVAGTAGQMNPIDKFFADWKAGTVPRVSPMPVAKESKPS